MAPRPHDNGLFSDDGTLETFLLANTEEHSHELVPELKLRFARQLEILWEKLEAVSGTKQEPPYWAASWPGGLAIARYILDHPDWVRGRKILDFAAGNGVAGLAAAMAGAFVRFNDIDRLSLRVANFHAAYHNLNVALQLGDMLDCNPEELGADLILVGDAFYERNLSIRLEKWLDRALESNIDVLVGDPGRNFLPHRPGTVLATYEIRTEISIEGRSLRTTSVFHFSHRARMRTGALTVLKPDEKMS